MFEEGRWESGRRSIGADSGQATRAPRDGMCAARRWLGTTDRYVLSLRVSETAPPTRCASERDN